MSDETPEVVGLVPTFVLDFLRACRDVGNTPWPKWFTWPFELAYHTTSFMIAQVSLLALAASGIPRPDALELEARLYYSIHEFLCNCNHDGTEECQYPKGTP